jgi:hypothetical protein
MGDNLSQVFLKEELGKTRPPPGYRLRSEEINLTKLDSKPIARSYSSQHASKG